MHRGGSGEQPGAAEGEGSSDSPQLGREETSNRELPGKGKRLEAL